MVGARRLNGSSRVSRPRSTCPIGEVFDLFVSIPQSMRFFPGECVFPELAQFQTSVTILSNFGSNQVPNRKCHNCDRVRYRLGLICKSVIFSRLNKPKEDRMEHPHNLSPDAAPDLQIADNARQESPASRAASHGLPRLDRTLYDKLFRLDAGRSLAAASHVRNLSRVALSGPQEIGDTQ